VSLAALESEEDLRVDLDGPGSESAIQRISDSSKFTCSNFHLNAFLCNPVEFMISVMHVLGTHHLQDALEPAFSRAR